MAKEQNLQLEKAQVEEFAVTRSPKSLLIRLLSFVHPQRKQPKLAPVQQLPLPSGLRFAESLAEKSFSRDSPPPPDSTVLYLAYGSNLCRETFQGRRGIRPLSAVNVVVPELKLTFDLPGIPYNEPCFANTARRGAEERADPEAEDSLLMKRSEDTLVSSYGTMNVEKINSSSVPLIGVVYEVTAEDYKHIIATEGPTYADVVVSCTALATPNALPSQNADPKQEGKPFKAHTLLAPSSAARRPPSGKPAEPSLRYLTLCRTGAEEHSLPEEWQSYLNGLQAYTITSFRQKVGRVVLIATFLPLILFVFGLRMVFRSKGRNSRFVNKFAMMAMKLCWWAYDRIFVPLFGDGERTEDS
jgi:hypothetical protein